MRLDARETWGSYGDWALWRLVIAGALLLGAVSLASAAPTSPTCLAKKLKEWGRLRLCEATENAKTLQARPADPAKCQARFDAKLEILNARAAEAGFVCRYGANGDGTVTDFDTGLQWEQKTDDGSIHDWESELDWSPSFSRPDGTAFTTFLGTLNNGTSSDGTTTDGCFAGHCDWRLPSIVELQTIVDRNAPGCGAGHACIDQAVFGPTLAFFYWSATTEAGFSAFAWGVSFGGEGGAVFTVAKDAPLFVRAVRSAL